MTFLYKGNSFGGIVNYLKLINQLDDIISVYVTNVFDIFDKEYIFHDNEIADHWVSEDGDNEYVMFTFNSIKPILTHYSIKSHPQQQFYIRSWSFWGSNDKSAWNILHSMSGSNDLKDFNVKTYRINNTNREAYRYYKIKKEGYGEVEDNRMRIADVEFFGHFIGFPTCFIKEQHSTYITYTMLLIFLI